METIEVNIKKPFAKQILNDLELMEAIEIIRKPTGNIDSSKLWGSWKKESREDIDTKIAKMRDEWERDI